MSGDRHTITDQNAMYFLTFTVVDWLYVFSKKEHKLELVNSMNYCIKEKGLIVYSWVLMNNHMHVIWEAKTGYQLSAIIRDYKKFTAKLILKMIEEGSDSDKDKILYKFESAGKKLNRISKYKFWQDSNHAIYLSDQDTKIMDQKLNYIHDNPVKALLVDNPEEYFFSSAIDYAGGNGLAEVTLMK